VQVHGRGYRGWTGSTGLAVRALGHAAGRPCPACAV